MTGHGGGDYKDLMVFLAAAGVLVPLFSRFRISPVLGFLAAGVLLGPGGLGRFAEAAPWLRHLTLSDEAQMRQLSELGVAFLLFMIGLEMSWERLRAMRRLVFGLGMLQIGLCAAALTGGFMLLAHASFAGAAVLGMGLALSSTAIVMPVLAERGRLKGLVGRSAFAVLLAQDLSVAPILITVTVLAALAQGGGALDATVLSSALFTLAPAALGLALLVVLGRLVLRPLFRMAARSRKPDRGSELFLAAALLVVVGAGVGAQAAGLSMSLGALIAGVLLAETEFRREVELAIEPFKGLLLGVFFVGVGLGLNLDVVFADPVSVFGMAALITAAKAAIIFNLARVWGLPVRASVETALVLGPAGEFAFVILGAGMVEGLVSPGLAAVVLPAATISMFTIPLMAMIGQKLNVAAAPPPADGVAPAPTPVDPPRQGAVILVGFGRVGRLVGDLLAEHDQRFIALDTDPATVAQARKDGIEAYYGDAGRVEMLALCGIESTRALVVTMDAPTKVDEVVRAARAARDDLIVIARARDDRHAARLYALGVTDAVPETTEASLQLAENTLVDLGVPMGLVLASVHEKREQFRTVFQAAAPAGRARRPNRALRRTPTPSKA
ncbi:MAG: cation:proton antiporter [Brevundimonas sp.]|uniref:cation:proton antiporter domain-containing protein n=1 Tax=Brevundimonas sp. TaxID=1871086 RepID=UPI0025C5BF2D|nr:cation:proton antiporter [Brevundimonas sp.]MBX3477030.1 cation:proton antiporter [Brevundimonas sp.]